MKPRRTLAFSALVLLAPCLLHAQPSPATVTGVVTGLVTDQSTHDPLESASVVLRSRADSSQVAGTTTGKDGANSTPTTGKGGGCDGPTTTTTDKGGHGSTTSTTVKGGQGSTPSTTGNGSPTPEH